VYPPHEDKILVDFPMVAGSQVIIDSMTIAGYYTGSPTLLYGLISQIASAKSWTLPAAFGDGYSLYQATIAVGVVIDGYNQNTHADNFQVFCFDALLGDIQITLNCRTCRGLLQTPIKITPIELYSDAQTMYASKLTTDTATLSSFATTLLPQSSQDRFDLVWAGNQTVSGLAALPASMRTFLIPGAQDSDFFITRICGRAELNIAATAGDQFTIRYGFGATGNSFTHTLSNGNTQFYFDSGIIYLQRSDRTLDSAPDDLLIQVDGVTASGTNFFKNCQIYVVSRATID
jgi:hypothetical protein